MSKFVVKVGFARIADQELTAVEPTTTIVPYYTPVIRDKDLKISLPTLSIVITDEAARVQLVKWFVPKEYSKMN